MLYPDFENGLHEMWEWGLGFSARLTLTVSCSLPACAHPLGLSGDGLFPFNLGSLSFDL